MQVAKLGPSGAPTAIKSDEGNNPLSAFIHQTIGKGPMFSLSMTGDNPMQWVQMFNPLGQSDLLGWPMFTPLKIQLQMCEKCSKEFCSPINYRRHIRMHRRQSRSLNVDKESHKNIDLLGAFWDTLSLEDAKNVVSIDNISLKEVSGSSVVEKLTIALSKPGVWTMPQPYVMAGSVLLEIIQAKKNILPISSQELFNILDYASERTFLCAGTAESVLKFIIDGEADEALEMRNLIASASLLFEQKLVKAWLVDKEAEALRCQKLLEKEEEDAEKRRSQLLKRRKQKQLRQQEQKARDPLNRERTDNNADSDDMHINSVDGTSVAEISVSQENNQDTLVDMSSFNKPAQLSNEDIVEARLDLSSDHVYDYSIRSVESLIQMENGHPQVLNDGWQVPKSRSQRSGRNGFHGSQNLRPLNVESFQTQTLLKDKSEVHSGKVLPIETNVESNDESSGIILQEVETKNIGKSDPKLLIGSISVPVSSNAEKNATQGAENTCSMDSDTPKEDKFPERNLNLDSAQEEIDQTTIKLCSICPAERSVLLSPSSNQDTVSLMKVEDNSGGSREIHLQSSPTNIALERNDQLQGRPFSSNTARHFLAKRWKETISSDHIKLVLSPDAPGNPDDQIDSSSVKVPSPGIPRHRGLSELSPIDKNTRAMSKRTTKWKNIL